MQKVQTVITETGPSAPGFVASIPLHRVGSSVVPPDWEVRCHWWYRATFPCDPNPIGLLRSHVCRVGTVAWPTDREYIWTSRPSKHLHLIIFLVWNEYSAHLPHRIGQADWNLLLRFLWIMNCWRAPGGAKWCWCIWSLCRKWDGIKFKYHPFKRCCPLLVF